MALSREDVPLRVAKILERPARWVPTANLVGDYEGRERTVEVFSAKASEQRSLLRRLRNVRNELEEAVGGPLIVIFHTPEETQRLYPDILRVDSTKERYATLARLLTEWMNGDHRGEPAVEVDQVERFTIEAA